MFSFFKTKKPSPEQTPSEPIPGPVPPPPREDDFIFVERKPEPTPAGGDAAAAATSGLYPAVPPGVATGPAPVRQRSEEKVGHVLHGVPFRLAPELCQRGASEVTQYQVNEMVAFLARTTQYRSDYDFSLERSIVQS